MHQTINKSFIVLILLTIIGVALSNMPHSTAIVALIILIAAIKFITVGFQFMELKIANNFWKALLIGYAVLIGGIYLIFLN
ncbi:MAG TPA: cytochrome C oxidase subunit IV family protein [Edaphocola sp.]|nr:cytochrome C oxidase subunit IV family protein [Edaphocola sp.]